MKQERIQRRPRGPKRSPQASEAQPKPFRAELARERLHKVDTLLIRMDEILRAHDPQESCA